MFMLDTNGYARMPMWSSHFKLIVTLLGAVFTFIIIGVFFARFSTPMKFYLDSSCFRNVVSETRRMFPSNSSISKTSPIMCKDKTLHTLGRPMCHPLMIIMMETSSRSKLTARQACAVESAALNNPSNQVTLFMTSSFINFTDSFMRTLRSIQNVQFVLLNLDDLFTHTPLENWYKKKEWLQSRYSISHLSDALRYLLLWKFGGIYLDLDVIVLRSLKDLSNCAGMEDEQFVGAGVMAFEMNHPFIGLCLEEFALTYKGDHWGYNGPELFTRVFKNMCKCGLDMMNRYRCHGVKVLPPEAFYAIPWNRWEEFFKSDDPSEVVSRWENSYVIHVWNKFSASKRIILGTDQPYELAAKLHCPSTYSKLSNGYF